MPLIREKEMIRFPRTLLLGSSVNKNAVFRETATSRLQKAKKGGRSTRKGQPLPEGNLNRSPFEETSGRTGGFTFWSTGTKIAFPSRAAVFLMHTPRRLSWGNLGTLEGRRHRTDRGRVYKRAADLLSQRQ
jgi:hypothetical protein